ncbi:MAG: hypothetical protein JWP03_331 [Phycisphaerales bacterium]|nr:hypothetical protein [Phycisphaerales bacterium]
MVLVMPLVRVVVEFMALVVVPAMPAMLVAVAFVAKATIVNDDRAGTVIIVVMMTGAQADAAADENSEPPMPGKNVAQRGIHGLDDKRHGVTWATEIPPADGGPPTNANGPNRLPMLAFPPARDYGRGWRDRAEPGSIAQRLEQGSHKPQNRVRYGVFTMETPFS